MGLAITSEFFPSGVDGFIHRYAYDASNRIEYHGWAKPGTADTATGWCIVKYTYDESNNPLTVNHPKNAASVQTNENVFIWDSHESYTYSA